jgi:hypothetical protein
MAGNSGLVPPSPSENRFVVDEESGLDVTHQITKSQRIVEVSLPTTRYVGTVDSKGFLAYGAAAVKAGGWPAPCGSRSAPISPALT